MSDYLPGDHSRAGGADWACWRIGKLLEKEEVTIDYYVIPADKKHSPDKNNVHFVSIGEKFLPRFLARYLEILKWYIIQVDPFAFFFFWKEFRRRRPDILHLHRFRFITMAPLLVARLWRIPVFFSVYDYWMFCTLETLIDERNQVCRRFHGVHCWRCLPRQFSWLQQILLLFRKSLFDWALQQISQFIVLSSSSAKILMDYGIKPEKIKIIHLPYGEQFQHLSEPDGEPPADTLLYVGWIQKRKGLKVLLQALTRIKKVIPTVKLYVIGPDVLWEKDYRQQIDRFIQENHLSENIFWLGPQTNEVVRQYITRSSVVVVPEQWENMSPVIVGEAMFGCRPVIGSNIGGIPDFVRDNQTGLLFNPFSEKELAEKIIYLLKYKDIAKTFGKKARELAEEIFSETRIIAEYKNLYKRYVD